MYIQPTQTPRSAPMSVDKRSPFPVFRPARPSVRTGMQPKTKRPGHNTAGKALLLPNSTKRTHYRRRYWQNSLFVDQLPKAPGLVPMSVDTRSPFPRPRSPPPAAPRPLIAFVPFVTPLLPLTPMERCIVPAPPQNRRKPLLHNTIAVRWHMHLSIDNRTTHTHHPQPFLARKHLNHNPTRKRGNEHHPTRKRG